MNNLIISTTQTFFEELRVKNEVNDILFNIIDALEISEYSQKLTSLHQAYKNSKSSSALLLSKLKNVTEKNSSLKLEMDILKSIAFDLRDKVLDQIPELFSKNSLSNENYDGLSTVKKSIGITKSSPNLSILEIQDNKNPLEIKKFPTEMLLEFDDSIYLIIFSFLKTREVLNFSQMCKFTFQRVDKIFSIDSPIIKYDWYSKPCYIETHSRLISKENDFIPKQLTTNSISTDLKLSRDLIESLSNRLNSQEIKIILGIADKLKKQSFQCESLLKEKDELLNKLKNVESIKDFLFEKLKSAETKLKELIEENSTIKKQSISDNEIISFLDIHVQDQDNQISELKQKISNMQVAFEFQISSLLLKEEQLLEELSNYKLKFESTENKSKSQKKILIKEVKLLRSQVELIEKEKESLYLKLNTLKDALNFN